MIERGRAVVSPFPDIEVCQECSGVGTPAELLIRVWGDDDEPDIYCAICYTNAPLDEDE